MEWTHCGEMVTALIDDCTKCACPSWLSWARVTENILHLAGVSEGQAWGEVSDKLMCVAGVGVLTIYRPGACSGRS